jgi:hypothetical protein
MTADNDGAVRISTIAGISTWPVRSSLRNPTVHAESSMKNVARTRRSRSAADANTAGSTRRRRSTASHWRLDRYQRERAEEALESQRLLPFGLTTFTSRPKLRIHGQTSTMLFTQNFIRSLPSLRGVNSWDRCQRLSVT